MRTRQDRINTMVLATLSLIVQVLVLKLLSPGEVSTALNDSVVELTRLINSKEE